jgi:hypothetical protein
MHPGYPSLFQINRVGTDYGGLNCALLPRGLRHTNTDPRRLEIDASLDFLDADADLRCPVLD